MAPAPSKPLTIQPERTSQRKRKASSKITDENFEGTEDNAVTKHLKKSADAARAAATKQQWQASVAEDEDEDRELVNNSPKRLKAPPEAADNVDSGMLDEDLASGLEGFDDDDGPEVTKSVETAEEQRSE
jgi:hypothetical protein